MIEHSGSATCAIRGKMTRKRHNRLKAKANLRFSEAVGSALVLARKKSLRLYWAIEGLPASEQQSKCSTMAAELYQSLLPSAGVAGSGGERNG